ncbi:MAG: hypothetical protein ACYTAO_11950 [Planctomycetota bacterium]|jgi:hypothetical protein
MKGPAQKIFVLVVGVAVMLIGGCGGQEPPSVKKSRAIAAENIELRKQLEQRGEEIEKLKARHGEEVKKQQNLLEKCEQEKQTWKTKAQQNIREQVKGVLDAVVEENVRLREENQALKAQIEELQKEP